MAMSQAEIDALLNGGGGADENNCISGDVSNVETLPGGPEPIGTSEEDFGEYLLFQELDAISEIGNITMGSASTPLSELLGVPVNISNPNSYIAYQEKVFSSFDTPYLTIQVDFTKGLKGFNVLVIKEADVGVIADLMLGGDGRPENVEVDEMAISATSEAMNQMNGAAATALSDMFGEYVEITPPRTIHVKDLREANHHPLPTDEPVVVVQFMLSVGDLLETTIMQITGIETAKEQVAYLFDKMGVEPPRKALETERSEVRVEGLPKELTRIQEESAAYAAGGQAMEVAMNLPLEATLMAGKINCRVADIAYLKPGMVVDVPQAAGCVQLVVNGLVVAEGELSDGKFRVNNLVKSSLK
ncbi:MAG: hypothetical protein VR68_04810 [Peptococcaceae bacterium BRH_c4a]|nr:MAG: hypothetical protein VR68_04810 [Peptococcaceae bacterium BRH_c4a]